MSKTPLLRESPPHNISTLNSNSFTIAHGKFSFKDEYSTHGKFKDEYSIGAQAVIVDYNKKHSEWVGSEKQRKEIARDVVQFFKNEWHIEEPSLIITVTGGAGPFQLNPNLQKVLRQGLVDAARDAENVVILTGGTHSGVMKHTGNAIQENSLFGVTCIGFSSFSSVNHSEAMENDFGEQYHGERKQVYEYQLETEERKKQKKVDLDPYHTHQVLIKDGSENSIDNQIEYWADIETAWRKERCQDCVTPTNGQVKIEYSTNRTNIPAVLICFKGGAETVLTCYKGLASGNPLVVVQDSGWCADWIAGAVLLKKEKHNNAKKDDKEFLEYKKEVEKYFEEALKSETIERFVIH